ncbi:MAG: helix-turn-helix domain-containing protein [Acidobacteria bacterium]|nr:helix-turn-helix domain-containing protein [Acidobacteriota bacterium]
MEPQRKLLTLTEVARELRCSKAHVSKATEGRVPRASSLPTVRLGRRKLVRREALDAWIQANERVGVRDKLPASSEVDVVRRIRGGI